MLFLFCQGVGVLRVRVFNHIADNRDVGYSKRRPDSGADTGLGQSPHCSLLVGL